MKLNKIEKMIKKTELGCEVTEITLLSEKEYEKYKHLIPLIRNWWCLRSPRYNASSVAAVHGNGGLTYANYDYTSGGVRPALWIVVPESLEAGDKIELNDITWTVLAYADGKFYVLADEIIGCHRFDSKSNIWEESELKKWLEKWKESWTDAIGDEMMQMTEQEKIEKLKNLFNEHELDLPETDSLEILHSAIEALEKQIPKKPTIEGDGYDPEGNLIYDTWICPNCETKYELEYQEYDHCPNCGQAIDWSENDETE